jgi:K+/H+ antiporter YhaU regulatory subunit KhtT
MPLRHRGSRALRPTRRSRFSSPAQKTVLTEGDTVIASGQPLAVEKFSGLR